MFHRKDDTVATTNLQAYATQKEFCRIFGEDQTALYLLSFLLTADAEKAELCFVVGLEDSMSGNLVFKEWARSWSKRMIVKNAIRIVAPAPGQANGQQLGSARTIVTPDFAASLADVLRLTPLERFVFVMSVLEGYSIQECSILLGCRKRDVAVAQARSLRQLSKLDAHRRTPVVSGPEAARHFLEPVRVA